MSSLPVTETRPAHEAASGTPADMAASLYEAYSERIFRFCRYRLGSREEAEDAAQTTFLRALSELERGVVPRLEANWLFTIANNACRTRIRSRGRNRRREVLSDPSVLQEVAFCEPASDEELFGLETALADMPDLQRQAIVLREWRGCSYREIAEELGLSSSAVETLIFRARRSLAQRLEHVPAATGRRTGVLALDLGSLFSSLKSLLGLGAGAKTGAVCATAGAIAIGLGVPADSVRPTTQPPPKTPALVAPVSPAADGGATLGPTAGDATGPRGPVDAPRPKATVPKRPASAPPRGPVPAQLQAPVAGVVGGVTEGLSSSPLTGPLVEGLNLGEVLNGTAKTVDETVGGALGTVPIGPRL